MPSRQRRRSFRAIAFGCVVATVLVGCSPALRPRADDSPAPTTRTERGLPADTMRSMAEELRSSAGCDNADQLFDDLSFWDAMQGFDCSSPRGPWFVRVYAHARSVAQTLEEWDGTFGPERTVVRGKHWYVIGPPPVVRAVEAPPLEPALTGDLPRPAPPSAEEDYLTTCTRYVASESERHIDHPRRRSPSAEQYEALFPGVTRAVHAAVDELHPERIRSVRDRDRWIAALSPVGPRMKDQCRKAYRKVHATVRPIDGSGS